MSKISVVIPVYNTQEYLQECLDSVVNQTLGDIEVILVDDGSTDGSTDICKEYAATDPRVLLIIQKNAGPAEARKTGANAATSPYLGFVDSDDTIALDMYEILLSNMGECDLVTSAALKEDGTIWKDNIPPGVYSSLSEMQYVIDNMLAIGNSFRRGITGSCACKLFRTDLAREVFEEVNPKIYFAEDGEFVFRYLLRCKSVHVTEICKYYYRLRQGSLDNSVHSDFLLNLNMLYLSLHEACIGHPREDRLIEQVQMYLAKCFSRASVKLGFTQKSKFLKYINPLYNELGGMRVALYGAGSVGKDYYLHMARLDNEPVIWVSRNYQKYQSVFPVRSVEELEQCEFDYLVVAVKDKNQAEEIKCELIARGVPEEKIVWREPIRVK